MKPVTHRVLSILGFVFKTACGKYVDGPNVTAYHKETTCKHCRRRKR